MASRRRFIGMSTLLTILALSTLVPRSPLAQPQCPSGYTPCMIGDSAWICISPGTSCGLPDSGSIESSRRGKFADMKILFTYTGDGEATVVSATMSVSASESAALEEGMFVTTVSSLDSPIGSVEMLRRQMRDQWKWIVSSGPRGAAPGGRPSFRFLNSGRLAQGGKASRRSGPIAELPAFPSHLTLATSSSGTTMTWSFGKPVTIRMLDGSARPGRVVTADAIELSMKPPGSPGLTGLEMQGEGIGSLRLGDFAVARGMVRTTPKTGAKH